MGSHQLKRGAIKRLCKDVRAFESSSILTLVQPQPDDLSLLYIDIRVLNSDLYPDTYRLLIRPSPTYPFDPPEVRFITRGGFKIPIHPHIYSNGHICLNLLYDGWSPANGLQSIGMSIQSMLAGNTIAARPPGDDDYCRSAPVNPQYTKWQFDDDTV